MGGNGKAHAKPFSKCTFHKKAKALARKALKAKPLTLMKDLYSEAFKREQGKQSKKTAKNKKRRPQLVTWTTNQNQKTLIQRGSR